VFTPHIEAKKEDIAEVVLMPGDPLRAKFVADNYLENSILVNSIRNMLAYTGYYNGKKVTIMGSGMGIPSMGIYSYELFKFYNVQKIIRIGSCGALISDLNLFDIVLVNKSYSDSTYAKVQDGSLEFLISSSFNLTNKIEEQAISNDINIIKGNVYTTDVFYRDIKEPEEVAKNNCIVTEMETFALFHNAKLFNKETACLLTVSDSPYINQEITAKQRETALIKMIELALKSI